MSDKHAGVVVTFEKDLSGEQIEMLTSALMLIRGVISVKPASGGIDQLMAEERVKFDLRKKLLDVLRDER